MVNKTLWHNANEEPKNNTLCLLQLNIINGHNTPDYVTAKYIGEGKWTELYISDDTEIKIIRWLYIDDLLKEDIKTTPSLEDYLQALPFLKTNDDGSFKTTDDAWAYTPTLCKSEKRWCINWVDEDLIAIKDIYGHTPTEAAEKAYNWCIDKGLIKDTLNCK